MTIDKKIQFMLDEIDEQDIEYGHTMTWFLSLDEARQMPLIQAAFLKIP